MRASPVTPSPVTPSLVTAADWLQRGQSLEAAGTPAALSEAIECYDRVIALLQETDSTDPTATRQLAIGWMNRGNALQKHDSAAAVRDAVRAYDRAIALFAQLVSTDNALLNSTGAAWLNRGQALQKLSGREYLLAAINSTEEAISLLCRLPVETNLDQRLNLAGAQLNLAQLLLESDATDRGMRASAALAAALELTARHEQQRAGFADLGLKARRTLCQQIGEWLIATDDPTRQARLIASASDAIDTGMTLARHWEALGVTHFRPLSERLFRFGTAFYQRHQVHFLADFVLENLDPATCSDAITAHAELFVIARETLTTARHDLRTNHTVICHDADSERRMQALQAIEDAMTLLATAQPSLVS